MNTGSQSLQAPLQGWQLVVVAFAINLGVFAEVLDLSIINVAVPAIAGGLSSSQTEATWAITAYAVAAAIVQPVTGWLTLRFGEVRVFTLSAFFFTLVSLLCGFAPNIELLVLFRLLQGAVGGPLIPLSQSLMLKTFPPHQRNLAQALWGMTALGGPIFGPILGGWLTDSYSWRWVFFINLPVGFITVVILWTLMRKRDTPTVRTPVDYVGALLLAAGIGATQFLFDHGHQNDWFDSPLIVGLALTALVSLLLFAVWEFYERYPIVSFGLFRKITFTAPVIVIAICYGAIFGTVVIFPVWLQSTLGYSATDAGLASASLGVAAVVSAIMLGVFGDRLPPRTAASVAFGLLAIGSAWQALLPADATFWQLSAPRILHGVCMPLFFLVLSNILYTGIAPSMIAAASSLSSFFRTMMVSLSTALSVTVWDWRTSVHHVLLAERVTPARTAGMGELAQATFGSLSDAQNSQALALLENLAQAQARTLAFNDLCWLSAGVFLLLIPFVWLPKPPFGGHGGGLH